VLVNAAKVRRTDSWCCQEPRQKKGKENKRASEGRVRAAPVSLEKGKSEGGEPLGFGGKERFTPFGGRLIGAEGD
jgi:hypothetical protein